MRMPALSSLTELNNKTSFGCAVNVYGPSAVTIRLGPTWRSEFQSLDQIWVKIMKIITSSYCKQKRKGMKRQVTDRLICMTFRSKLSRFLLVIFGMFAFVRF